MTREEKKMIRLRIIELLNQCEGCPHHYRFNACVRICPSCPNGQQMQALGRKLGARKKKQTVVMKAILNRRPWTAEEEEFLLQNLHMRRKELAEMLGRSHKSVQKKISALRKRGRIHAS